MMALQAPLKPSASGDFDDDDDAPIVFKRSSTTSKKNPIKTEVKKPPSQRNDALSGSSGLHSSNGQSARSQQGKVHSSPKTSSTKSPDMSPNASSSTAKLSPVMSPLTSLKSSKSPDDQLRHSSKQSPVVAAKEESNSDSDDDKPLSSRLQDNSGKSRTMHILSPSSGKGSVKSSPEDSDDEKPLASRLPQKSNAPKSSNNRYASDEKKPLVPKTQQNGFALSKDQAKSSTVSNKRPLEKTTSSDQLSVKKLKTSEASTSIRLKPSVKGEPESDDDDHIPISQRMKKPAAASVSGNKSSSAKDNMKKVIIKKKITKPTKNFKKVMKKTKYSKSTKVTPTSGDGQKKWTTLVHNGVIFPPPYKPHGVKMLYKGKPVDLTPGQEEVATMFAVMKDTDYMQKDKFKENFWTDWRKILGSNHVIQKLEHCDFTPIYDWYQQEKEKKKQMTKEEKNALKEEKTKQEEKYMWAIVDGVKEKVGNFRVEPPGLFRGRGEHPKMGKLKRRIRPRDITINIGKGVPVPECPIPGEKWKEVRHDDTVTWLAFWNDPINPKEFKYVFLAASSSLKGQSDKEKYEKARMLKDYIENIRAAYTKDFTSKDAMKRQIAVATYLIDKLALRAGNEKDDDEADTVGCCTLKVENVKAISPNSLEFNFLGKDSIRYENTVEVELPVYKAIVHFQSGKKPGDPLFDELDTSKLNAHLKELMPGLTAKVFRTYNASITLDEMLSRDTKDGEVAEKVVVYQRANKEVAIICNHQRSISKSHVAQMTKLQEKIDELKDNMKELKVDLDRARKGKPPLKDADGKRKRNLTPEAIEKKTAQIEAKIEKMERDKTTREDLKTVALGTSKINYLDPRITVAWCKRHEVPIEKIFNKSLLAKFAWAMDVEPDFRF
ncbi:DNA topoisomerase 1 alpha-like [Rhodamnia argentea]|uniref:DNA topoisomerase I n=1 Tax=Rhodamnia argentea TaxID=178133 RepID=A0A8B8QHW0_9MYRT|nr:DNA topoisomerase 1 alpha-like [Rhodamnia argentea]XP_030546645.1 DNA topoisomerase 1 alpha-like [Rhodamnia argentea]